jgi:splicing factor 3B subunit 3
LNRNAEGKLFPSSPLEAHKAHTLVTHIISVDQGYDNPLYAALEMDYSDSDEDPTGEAYEKVQKVSSHSRKFLRVKELTISI